MNLTRLFLFFERNILVPYFSYLYINKITINLNKNELLIFNEILLLYQNLLLNFLELEIKNIDNKIWILKKNIDYNFWDILFYKFFSTSIDWINFYIDKKHLIKHRRFCQKAINILKSDIILKNNDISLKNFNAIAIDANFMVDLLILKDNIYEAVYSKSTFLIESIINISRALIKYVFCYCLYINVNRCGRQFPSYLLVIKSLAKSLRLPHVEIIQNLKFNLIDLNFGITYNDYLMILNKRDAQFVQNFTSFLFKIYLDNSTEDLMDISEKYEETKHFFELHDTPWWHIERVGLITKEEKFFRYIIYYLMDYPNPSNYRNPGFHYNPRYIILTHLMNQKNHFKSTLDDLKNFEANIKLGDNTVFIKNKLFFHDHIIIYVFNYISYYNKERDKTSCGYFLLKFLLKNNIKICFGCSKGETFSSAKYESKIELLAYVLGVSFKDIESNLVD